jgi:glycosyltransferase involved in cell wall biosynthesis
MTEPLVTTIIPSYNSEKYVVAAIESVLQQSYTPIEIIVVDDGSTDQTKQRIDALIKSQTIRYIYQSNQGLSAARNTGLRIAKGKYVQFLDADDLLEPHKIEKQVTQLESANQPAISGCDFRCFDDHNPSTFYDGDFFKGQFPLSDPPRLFDFYTVIHRWLFPASIFNEVGLFDPTLPATEDWLMLWKIAANGIQFLYLDEPLVRYRKHERGMTSDFERITKGRLMAINRIEEFQQQSGVRIYSANEFNALREPVHYELALHFLRSNRKLRAWQEVIRALALSSNRRQIKLLLLAASPALGARAIEWVGAVDNRLWHWRLQLRKTLVG